MRREADDMGDEAEGPRAEDRVGDVAAAPAVERSAEMHFRPAADPGARDAERKALRRVTRRARPAWLKKLIWFIFPTYGIMRVNDPDFEEHADQWRDQQRRNYLGRG